MRHTERHRIANIGWLRAAVLGANDGIVSTASLLVGVAAAQGTPEVILTTGIAALVAGAMSMAAGEYVSVRSQADTEEADLDRERAELKAEPEAELRELTVIYERRGLDAELARRVATELMRHDALGAHARDELGISARGQARPLQAAMASAASFACGALLPVIVAWGAPATGVAIWVAATSVVFLAALGALAAWAGGARKAMAAARIAFWGALAMAVTAGSGWLFNLQALG